jgi:DNA uptake protein ComE-like DNA-binding protein
MKEKQREQFYFYRSERHGLYALLLIIAVTWSGFTLYPYLAPPDAIDKEQLLTNHVQWLKADSLDQVRRKAAYKAKYKTADKEKYSKSKKWSQPRDYNQNKRKPKTPRERFVFDPNTLSADSLKRLGFKSWIADNIEKYRNSGGTFREASDLLKIRNIDSSLVTELLPMINIEPTPDKQWPKRDSTAKPENNSPSLVTIDFIDINSANQYQWMLLPGIGEAKARIIVEEREKLGGFHSVNQLKEVWGIDDDLYAEISPQLEARSPIYRKLRINLEDVEGLAQHKYINYKRAKIICAYRKHHGPYQSTEDLNKIIAFDESFVQKIEPYLDFSTTYITR